MSPEQKRVMSKLGKMAFNSFEGMARKIGVVNERNLKYSQYILQHIDDTSVVLDVGCNVGSFTSDLSKKAAQVISMDFDREILHYVPRIQGVHRLVCDAQNLPLRKESIDRVIAISVLEHLRNPEFALTEFKRVLTKKGGLIVQIPNPEYFIEPHTKFPLIFLLPESIRDKINVRTFGYYYTNFRLSKKKLIQLLMPIFVLREAKPVYHRLRTPPWPPSWVMFLTKKPAD